MLKPSYLVLAFLFVPLTVQAQVRQGPTKISPRTAASVAIVKTGQKKPRLARPTAAQRGAAPGNSIVVSPNGEVRISRKILPGK